MYSEKALELDSQCYEGYVNKSSALLGLSKYDEALECCNKAIENKLEDYKIYYNKGLTLEKKGRLEEALVALDKSLEFKPDDKSIKGYRSKISSKIAIKKFIIGLGIFLFIAVSAIITTIIYIKRSKIQNRHDENLYRGLE